MDDWDSRVNDGVWDDEGEEDDGEDWEHTDTCPEHGEQEVTGGASTGGADPYHINILACGHGVLCMGPGEENMIVPFRRDW